VLARSGWVRPPGQTPLEFAAGLGRRDPVAGAALSRLSDAFCRERYGGVRATRAEADALARDVDVLRGRRRTLGIPPPARRG
jgi:hypothetical protein